MPLDRGRCTPLGSPVLLSEESGASGAGDLRLCATGGSGQGLAFHGTLMAVARIEASAVVALLGAGHSVREIARQLEIPEAAVEEAAELAARRLRDWRVAA